MNKPKDFKNPTELPQSEFQAEDKKRLSFYKAISWGVEYSTGGGKIFYTELVEFIGRFNLQDKKLLEIGSGIGALQDIVSDYTGLDIVYGLKKFYHKPYFVTQDDTYPFSNDTFDGIFTRAVFEHIPSLDKALQEMIRVLKKGGYCLFAPAWHVRSWAAQGYAGRSYKNLSLREKLIKFSILWRGALWYRSLKMFFQRALWTFQYFIDDESFKSMPHKKLTANYDVIVGADSDACNSLDQYAAILYFRRNKCEILNKNSLLAAFFARTSYLVVKKLD